VAEQEYPFCGGIPPSKPESGRRKKKIKICLREMGFDHLLRDRPEVHDYASAPTLGDARVKHPLAGECLSCAHSGDTRMPPVTTSWSIAGGDGACAERAAGREWRGRGQKRPDYRWFDPMYVARGFRRSGGRAVLHQCIRLLIGACCAPYPTPWTADASHRG
jgi:hypothetical protein